MSLVGVGWKRNAGLGPGCSSKGTMMMIYLLLYLEKKISFFGFRVFKSRILFCLINHEENKSLMALIRFWDLANQNQSCLGGF